MLSTDRHHPPNPAHVTPTHHQILERLRYFPEGITILKLE